MPLVFQAFNWIHGVYLGATMGSEMTAAAAGTLGQVRRDPFAMLPFCGYHMGDYFDHWLEMRRNITEIPRMFLVNWFRKDADGKFLWPGFGENMRVLKWIVDRCKGRIPAHETAVGWMPAWKDFESAGLPGFDRAKFDQVMAINQSEWRNEIMLQDELYLKLYHRMPKELIFQRELLVSRL
jgi:phosphoenolpyruvate carboxykinase (GTP)